MSSKRITTICTGINGHVQNNYLKNPEKLILWAGSNFEGKGGKELLQVFRKIRSVDPEYKLVFVGVDFEISEPGVRTYPFLHGTDLHILEELFEKAMVFVMPSFRECSGLVFFEAMARKTPIVVPTRGGMAEIVRRTGCGEIAKTPYKYITEKIFDCFMASTVPIYSGCENISTYISREAYILLDDFTTMESLHSYLKRMSKEEYEQYLSAGQQVLTTAFAKSYGTEAFVGLILEIVNNLR